MEAYKSLSFREFAYDYDKYKSKLDENVENILEHFIKLKLTTSFGDSIYKGVSKFTKPYQRKWVETIKNHNRNLYKKLNDKLIKKKRKETKEEAFIESFTDSDLFNLYLVVTEKAVNLSPDIRNISNAVYKFTKKNGIWATDYDWFNDIIEFYLSTPMIPKENSVISIQQADEELEKFISNFVK